MVEEDEPCNVGWPCRRGEQVVVQGAPQLVGGEEVETGTAYQRRRPGHRVEDLLQHRSNPGGRLTTSWRRPPARRPRQVVQVSPLRLVEPQGVGHGVEDGLGRTAETAAFEPGVVV